MKQGKRSVTEYWNVFHLVASEAELDHSTGGELPLGGMITELQNAWGSVLRNTRASRPWHNGQSGRRPNWPRSGTSQDRHQQKATKEKRSHHETQTEHIEPQTIAIKPRATLWN